MTERKGILTDQDHKDIDGFFLRALNFYKSGDMSAEELIPSIGQVIGAIDTGNIGDVRAWTKNPGNLEYQIEQKPKR
jgi:hypothetical protein